jgi:hypothetical protein
LGIARIETNTPTPYTTKIFLKIGIIRMGVNVIPNTTNRYRKMIKYLNTGLIIGEDILFPIR